MTPYYQDDAVTLYHGDCREILPTLAADITVTSPPYNTLPSNSKPSGMHAERRSGVNKWMDRAAKGYADVMPEDEYQEWLRGIIGLCLEASAGLVWVNHKTRYRDGVGINPLQFLPFPLYSEVVWNRRVSMALNCRRYAPSHEFLLGFGTPNYWDDSLNARLSVWNIPFDTEPIDHPCSYPVALISPLIFSSCQPYGVVLDPFAGSGTTLRAAKDLGRKAIGIEICEKYCEITARRMQQGVFDFEGTKR